MPEHESSIFDSDEYNMMRLEPNMAYVKEFIAKRPDHKTWTCAKHGVQHYTMLTIIIDGTRNDFCPHCIGEFFGALPRMTLNGDNDV